ncbi:MAG: hypothetical protein ACI9Z3_000694 [Roseivirga sp.]|jgi:hypothetical protein
MKRILYLSLAFLLLFKTSTQAQETELTGAELLKRSISFHDPNGQWVSIRLELVLDQEMPDSSKRPSKVIIDNKKGDFELSFVKNSHLFTWKVGGQEDTESYMDYRVITDSIASDTLGLNPERALRWRNYYSYLYGLPMKLTDQGTKVDPKVQSAKFDGKDVLALKVTYDAKVGKDIWYFYFNPETYAMEGYRFYHDEAKNDGEYILISGLEIQNGLRIPKDRAWYTNDESKWLGTDRFIQMKVIK